MRYLIWLGACLVLPLIGMAARAEEPAGIVMAITGDSNPPLSVMAEIPAGQAFQLMSDAKLTFMHYARCKLVTVVGGTLVLETANYKAGGTVTGETDAPCPQSFQLSAAGSAGRTTGGIVARSISLPPRWPVSPQLVFAGPRAGTVTGAAVLTENRQPVVRFDVGSGWGKLPPGAPPLQPGARYTLRLTLRDQAEPIDVPFATAKAAQAGPPIVLRFD